MEQLNIVGKRSGAGLVVHKATLVDALSRVLADRIELLDITIGCKGFLNYLKSLAGSNVVKIVPANDNASEPQVIVTGLKVVCGSHTSYLKSEAWIGDKTPMTFAEIRVCPRNTVKPNIGTIELAEALDRVLPFTSVDDGRPVLQCIKFEAKEGKLKLVGADGFRLAEIILDFDDVEGQIFIHRDDLKGISSALRKAKRARLAFDEDSLIIDTEIIRYKLHGVDGSYPDYEKVIPVEFNATAHFDALGALKALNSLKVLGGKGYAVDLVIGDGKIIMTEADGKGQTEITADTTGNIEIRVNGDYLAQTLIACGSMVDFQLVSPISAMLFSLDSYRVVVMPVVTDKAKKTVEQKTEDEAEPNVESEAKSEVEPVEPEVVVEVVTGKGKKVYKKRKEPVAVS